MSATPKELIDCAAVMLQVANDEPMYRAICSRAYYGAFHSAREFHEGLSSPGSVGNARGRHEQLIAQLNTPTVGRADKKFFRSIALGKTLRLIVDARVQSDYKIDESVDQQTAVKTLQSAQSLHTAANS
jgi:uncharacterized protein (UPF0332 family)